MFLDQWFVGCSASHVICEGAAIQRYLGHSNNLVTVSVSALHSNAKTHESAFCLLIFF